MAYRLNRSVWKLEKYCEIPLLEKGFRENRGGANDDTAGTAKKRQSKAEAIARNTLVPAKDQEEADILPDRSMLCVDFGKVGMGKHLILDEVLTLVSDKSYCVDDVQFGYDSQTINERNLKAIQLYPSKEERDAFIKHSKGSIVQLCDFMKDLQRCPDG